MWEEVRRRLPSIRESPEHEIQQNLSDSLRNSCRTNDLDGLTGRETATASVGSSPDGAVGDLVGLDCVAVREAPGEVDAGVSPSHSAVPREQVLSPRAGADGGVCCILGNSSGVPVCGVSSSAWLALCIQRAWRRRRCAFAVDVSSRVCEASGCAVPASSVLTHIEENWKGQHRKKHGSIGGHVRFLQWLYRAVRSLAPDTWGVGRVPGFVWVVIRLCRRHRWTKCKMGVNLASRAEFMAQKKLANEMLDWYGQYVAVVRGRCSGDAVRVFDDFCGAGLSGEGIRRAGGIAFGMDVEDQPSYKRRFSPDCFKLGDGVDWSLVRMWQKKHRLRCAGASPPCKWYSTARQQGEASQPPLIGQTRDMLNALFDWWWIENVMGAKSFMQGAVEVDGPFFGEMVFRARLFETNFPLHIDECVRASADVLRSRCCLGRRNRWRPFDEFGRPYVRPCCSGNVWVPIGDTPWRCSAEECAVAMGVDPDHTTYDRLAQGIPPSYAQWVFGQMCMQMAHAEYGCPIFTFDSMKENPALARRTLASWLRLSTRLLKQVSETGTDRSSCWGPRAAQEHCCWTKLSIEQLPPGNQLTTRRVDHQEGDTPKETAAR